MQKILSVIGASLLVMLPEMALACSVCFSGDADSPASRGLRWGILTLLAVLAVIMAVFLYFLTKFNRRTKMVAESL